MPLDLTPEERSMRARIAANTRWANKDRKEASDEARRRLFDHYENVVDPDRVLRPDERAKRADNALRAHMESMALKSAKKRRKAKEAAEAEAVEP